MLQSRSTLLVSHNYCFMLCTWILVSCSMIHQHPKSLRVLFSTGMVTMLSPNTTLCYESSTVLKCTIEEKTDSPTWTLNQKVLNAGTVVQVNNTCAPTQNSTCTALTLQSVTGAWVGKYQEPCEVWFCVSWNEWHPCKWQCLLDVVGESTVTLQKTFGFSGSRHCPFSNIEVKQMFSRYIRVQLHHWVNQPLSHGTTKCCTPA